MRESTTPISQVPLTIVDVETTGLVPSTDRIVEVALLRVRGGTLEERFSTLVNPRCTIPPDAQAIHGITSAMVRDQPPFAAIVPQLSPYFCDGAILGHNVDFDLGFLRHELARAGHPAPDLPKIDTLALARRHLRLSSHSLGTVARHLGLPAGGHRALGDATTTWRIFQALVRLRNDEREPTLGDLCFPPERSSVRPPDAGGVVPPELVALLQPGRRLILRYRDAREQVSERLVEVVAITEDHLGPCLIAYCHLRRDQRTFRLDRILGWQPVEPGG
ncbi:MAG: WYL domain-containing protein [Chloroflexi bacterium]|nr:WYL domain-containing protein [Chloroflexota bacterium]